MRITSNYYKRKSKLKTLLIIVFSLALLFSGYKITMWFINNNENNDIQSNISKYVSKDKYEDKYKINFSELKKINNDTVAWLKVNNTNIEYVVTKSSDNDFYLKHNFNKKYNTGGWIFADYRNKFDGNDLNTIIYGHNMKNGTMFGTLKNTLNSDWYNNDDNRYIILVTEDGIHKYEIFSIYTEVANDYPINSVFESAEDYYDFLVTLRSKSISNFNTKLSPESSILTLSTCADNNKYRVLVHAIKLD